jgi:hypothetical protein
MATRGRDLDPGIRITFLGGGDDGDDGASDVAKHAYESDKGEPFEWVYGTYCPRPQVVRTNPCHIFLALHQRDVGHPISNRAELRCQGPR